MKLIHLEQYIYHLQKVYPVVPCWNEQRNHYSLLALTFLSVSSFDRSYKTFGRSSNTYKSFSFNPGFARAWLKTSSRSLNLRNLAVMSRGPFQLGLPSRWILWNSIRLRGLTIFSPFSRNSCTSYLVFSICWPSGTFSGIPANFKFSRLLFAYRYRSCFRSFSVSNWAFLVFLLNLTPSSSSLTLGSVSLVLFFILLHLDGRRFLRCWR